ncbi:TetR/AcrR family transcriptional regulator [Actinobacteria bacterium YIM 96077]|uniref:TetR/AcrR family transcriptional regulator n=1 Tax=Phytoactinopolyspora halophila TaxID=1981511 RepID=A0A329R0L1_9ACTN|nr:TetR family transcriptional regulator [Phytoactinopolyspora halophila]AYY15447.1 TetR/AcrR family transcriptional regulator [Actinobacteria bacterium YIM 96077]RAW17696.1 TetR/AcrR family transcriptional regulator [Phytoactinopolyspora halophila]
MPRDPSATRAELLAAARDEFAAHGVGGARVARIAERAGVNKERIYGHFGSKEALFEEVMVDVLHEHTAALGLPSGDLAAYVGRIYDFHRENPQLLRLLMWEALHYGDQGSLPRHEERSRHYARKVQALADALDAPADVHAATMLITLIGLAAWPSTLPQLTGLILERFDEPGKASAQLREQLMETTRRMVGDR